MGTIQAKITPERTSAIERAAEDALRRIAVENRIADPVIRDLLPGDDLNALSGNIWQQVVSTLGFATNYSGTNPDDLAIVIFGAKNKAASPLTVAIRFFEGVGRTAIKDIWQIEHGQTEDDTRVFASEDSLITYLPSKGFNIDFFGKLAGTDNIILLGKTVEPKGTTVSPRAQA